MLPFHVSLFLGTSLADGADNGNIFTNEVLDVLASGVVSDVEGGGVVLFCRAMSKAGVPG